MLHSAPKKTGGQDSRRCEVISIIIRWSAFRPMCVVHDRDDDGAGENSTLELEVQLDQQRLYPLVAHLVQTEPKERTALKAQTVRMALKGRMVLRHLLVPL
jgi:hypothetical protein